MALPIIVLGSFQSSFLTFLSVSFISFPLWPLHVIFSFCSPGRSGHSQCLRIGSWINCPSLVICESGREGSDGLSRAWFQQTLWTTYLLQKEAVDRAGIWSLGLASSQSSLPSSISQVLSTYSVSGARDTAANQT